MVVMQSEVEAALASTEPLTRTRHRSRRDRDPEVSIMKKYTKLILCIIALISSLCFVIYKYRYDRLYHVMQVLEVFGSPDQPDLSQSPCPDHPPADVMMTSPGWQHLGGGLWVYAAYCSGGGQVCSHVTAVGVLQDTAAETEVLQCALWYEESPQHLQGLLSVTTSKEGVTTFTCESKYPNKTPYAVAIYQGKGPQYQVQIQQPVTNKSLMNICILPDSPLSGDNTKSLQESLIFHSFVGVNHIRLYSSALSGSVLRTLASLMKSTNISIEVVPWNVPISLNSSVTETIVSQDCYYASRNRFDFYAVLNSHQIMMPLKQNNIQESLKLLNNSVKKGPNKVRVKMFCSEYPSEKKAKNLSIPISMLESTWYNKDLSKDGTINAIGSEATDNTDDNLETVLSINEYRACDKYDISETDPSAVYEGNALKFSSKLVTYYRKFS